MARRYFFHMTDGVELIIDRRGRWASSKRHVEPEALTRALRTMREAPAEIDWSDWQVSVHDQDGNAIAHLPFPANHA